MLSLLELRCLRVVLCQKLPCFTRISSPDKSLNSSSENDVSWRSLLQYLNTKFPLEYVYSGTYGLRPISCKFVKGNRHAPYKKDRQDTKILFFLCVCVFCFVFFLLVNFYSLGPGEDIINPESEFGIFSPL